MLVAQVAFLPRRYLHPCLVSELDGLRSDMAKVTCLFGCPECSHDLVVG